MKNVIIRADSSSTMGTGHIMRDMVLANRDFADDRVIFATQNLPGNINHKIDEAGYEKILLESGDIVEFIETILPLNPETVVIDHYGIDYRDEKRIKEATGATLFVLDDTYERHHCDVLLNHNVSADEKKYKDLIPKVCEIRCGDKYTLIRDEFLEAKERQSHLSVESSYERPQVLIAMGGADHSQINIQILESLKGYDAEVHVVTTTANRGLEALKRYVSSHERIVLHIETNRMAELLTASDLAIVSPSVVLNEVIFLGVPFIAIKTAENQEEMYLYLAEQGYPVLEQFDSTGLQEYLERIIYG